MKEVDVTPNLDGPPPARKLTREFYDIYTIEDKDQTNLYDRLAALVNLLNEEHPSFLIESLTPGFYTEGPESFYTLLVTVAH